MTDFYWLSLTVEEANNPSGQRIFQSAGSMDSNSVSVWDGSGATNGYYTCTIRFKNNYGREFESSYTVLVIL